jgi:GT2 family glycosyltransferase
MRPVFSVVVATYNRQDVLQKTLEHLAVQNYPADQYEVIVVDDGSPDHTGDMVRSLIGSMPYKLTYLVHENRGPGASENRGIQAAEGEWIVLLADDIQPAPGLLQSYAEFHRLHPEPCFAALGQVLQSPDLPSTAFQQHWDPFKYFELAGETELPYWKFWACNISVKRLFLLEHGLFLECKGAAHEDVELGYRLHRAGLRILYLPEALAYHFHVETLEAAVKRAYERGLKFHVLTDNIPDPQLVVKYHVLNPRTWRQHVQTFRNLAHTSLPPGDRNLIWLLTRQFIRWAVFNGVTIRAWLSILRAAETRPWLSRMLHPYMYRGAVFYHFTRGARDYDLQKKRGGSAIISTGRAAGQSS